jgi:hypothetical protein
MLQARQYLDRSGMRLHLERAGAAGAAPRANVGVMTWRSDVSRLVVPPTHTDNGGVTNGGKSDGDTTRGRFEYKSVCNPLCMEAILGADFDLFGELTFVSAKLHAHNHATKMELLHLRSPPGIGQARHLVQSVLALDPFCGYGECQKPVVLPRTLKPMLRGDSLELHCFFDNQGGEPIHYGVTNDGEMCGTIIMYSPHNATHWTKFRNKKKRGGG